MATRTEVKRVLRNAGLAEREKGRKGTLTSGYKISEYQKLGIFVSWEGDRENRDAMLERMSEILSAAFDNVAIEGNSVNIKEGR